MRGMMVLSTVLLVTLGCTRISADYHLDGAYRAYAKGDCNQVMLEVSQAERNIKRRPQLQPELSFLRAQCLERQKFYVDAVEVYQFIQSQYASSEYSYRAKARLDTLEQLGVLKGSGGVKALPVPLPAPLNK